MAVVDTVAAAVSMVVDFLDMLDSLRRVGSRIRVGSRVRVVMVAGIELLMAAEPMRRGMGCRDGRSVAGWAYRVRGRGFITAGMIGAAGMGMGWGMGMGRWIMAGSTPTIRNTETMVGTMLDRMMTVRA
jgi:hypothetical protein